LPDAETKLDKGCVKLVPVERPGDDGHGSQSPSAAERRGPSVRLGAPSGPHPRRSGHSHL